LQRAGPGCSSDGFARMACTAGMPGGAQIA